MFNENNIFGELLLKLREEHGESQQELADYIGITRQSLSRYELGERTANIDILRKIVQHYNVSADYLIGLQETKTKNKDITFICEYTGLSEASVWQLKINSGNPIKSYFSEITNWLIEECFLTEIVENLYNLKNKSSIFMDGKKNKSVAAHRQAIHVRDCDVIRYKLHGLIEHLSNQFDQRKKED